MKFSFEYVKKNPVMFGTIFVVFGLLIYLMLNRSAASSNGPTSYVSSGPSDTQVAGQVALGQASIAANSANQQMALQLASVKAQGEASIAALTIQGQNELALGKIAADLSREQIAAERDLGTRSIDAQLAAQMGQFGTTLALQMDSNATQLGIYNTMALSAMEQTRINAELQTTLGAQSAALQTTLGAQAADAFKQSQILSIIPTLKKKDRDNALVSIVQGTPYRGYPSIGANNVSPLAVSAA